MVCDFKLAKRVARYLAGSPGLKWAMKCDGKPGLPLRIECFTDADFSGDKQDRKSVSGGIVRINGMPVVGTARSKRQWQYQLLRRNMLLRLLAAKILLD